MQKKNSFFSKNNFWILGEKLLEYLTLLNYVTNSSKFTHLKYGIQ